MNNGMTIVAAVFFAAGALLSQPIWRQAEAVPLGPYWIAPAPQANINDVWILNMTTGQLRICQPPTKRGMIPKCWPWTQ